MTEASCDRCKREPSFARGVCRDWWGYLWKRLSGSEREDGLSKYREAWGVGGGHRQESVVTIAVTWSGQHAELFCCLKQSHTNEEASLWPCGRECQP